MTTNIPTISFSYPRRGLSGEFATFRLGARAAEKHPIGSRVDLIDSRSKRVLKSATVVSLHTGVLTEMAQLHAHQAHNWKEYPEAERPGLLIASILKRFKHYGPTRCSENSLVSVIYLKEITMNTIVTHSYLCDDCGHVTDMHVEDGSDLVKPDCEECGSKNTCHTEG